MKEAVEMGSGDDVHIKFLRDRFRHSVVHKGGIHRQQGNVMSLLSIFTK
jgi:hypothetical protein